MSGTDSYLDWLLRRIDRFWTKFEETGDERYADLAATADQMYLRAKATQ